MSPNSLTVKKYLLTAGLLIVLGQGLWQLPELQDYLLPDKNMESILNLAHTGCEKIEHNLIMLNDRINYLKWFQTHNGHEQKVSADRLLAFPFSESIRPLSPGYIWHINIFLAHKDRMRAESRLRHLNVAFKSLIDDDFRVPPSHKSPVIPANKAVLSGPIEQIKQFQDQCVTYNTRLMKLTQQLNFLENNANNN